MIHYHFQECESTQDFLLDRYKFYNEQNILVSAQRQTKGRGRNNNKWYSAKNLLACSFTLSPCSVPTLTSLEISVLIIKYLVQYKDIILFLKWPNDIFNDAREKVGGILIQSFQYNNRLCLIVGIGLNLFANKNEIFPQDSKNKVGSVFKSYIKLPPPSIFAQNAYKYILNNRMNPIEIQQTWLQLCMHLNKKVQLKTQKEENNISGKFIGISSIGEALIETNEGLNKIISGSIIY